MANPDIFNGEQLRKGEEGPARNPSQKAGSSSQRLKDGIPPSGRTETVGAGCTCCLVGGAQRQEQEETEEPARGRGSPDTASFLHGGQEDPEPSLVAQTVKRLPAMQETRAQSLGREDPLEREMAPHSSILAWKMPWTEEPGRLQSMGSQRVGHDWATSLSLFKKTVMGQGVRSTLGAVCNSQHPLWTLGAAPPTTSGESYLSPLTSQGSINTEIGSSFFLLFYLLFKNE